MNKTPIEENISYTSRQIRSHPHLDTLNQMTGFSKSRNNRDSVSNIQNTLIYNSDKVSNQTKKFLYSNFNHERSAFTSPLTKNFTLKNNSRNIVNVNNLKSTFKFSTDKLYYLSNSSSMNRIKNLKTQININNDKHKRASYDGSNYKLV